MKIAALVFLLILLSTSPLFAVEYRVNVVRQGGNLYWAEAEKMYIQTAYCSDGSDAGEAMLRINGDSRDITFPESGYKCDVKMIFGQTELKVGKYSIHVSREDDNWYKIVDKKMALKTDGCFSLVENMQAGLQINADGSGTLSMLEADEECAVEGVYSEAQLQLK